MKSLIYGSNGWIGNQFINLLKEKHEYVAGNARLDNIESVIQEIEEIRPTHIFLFVLY